MSTDSKKILVVLDPDEKSFAISSKIQDLFFSWELKNIFYYPKSEEYTDNGRVIESIEKYFLNFDVVVNLMKDDSKNSKKLFDKIDFLKIKTFQNSFATEKLFSKKINIKKILERSDFKSPVFEIIGGKTPEGIFANFSMPCRIFSKENDYFSGEISDLGGIKKEFAEIGQKIEDYIVEEYLDGIDYWVFVAKNMGGIKTYGAFESGDGLKKISHNDDLDLVSLSEGVFKDFGVENFALMHFKKVSDRGFYLMNVFVELDILVGEKEDILESIFVKEGVNIKDFFQNFVNHYSLR